MFRAGMIRRAARVTMKGVGGGTALGAAAGGVYLSTEQGRGLRREVGFWRGVAPVVLDYYWNFASSSPYVKYQKYLNEDEIDEKETRKKKLKQLHHKHAPKILDVLLELKGLYVKLGQVLSVTTLPVPEAYREKFRTLQSDCEWEAFEEMVKPTLERELGRPLEEVFLSIDPVPCGAASIGQAHKAVLKADDKEDVVIKIQYPDAAWQIPADIQCVGDFLKICVFFGVVDESAANLSFNEFSRQFKAELDYDQERRNLEDIYQSSLDPNAPYLKRGVVLPHVYPDLCTSRVITMSYLPGPKLEEEARRQLEALGIDTKKGIRGLVRAPTNDQTTVEEVNGPVVINGSDINEPTKDVPTATPAKNLGWKGKAAQLCGKLVGVDSLLGTVRLAHRVKVWCTAATVKSIDALAATPVAGSLIPSGIVDWAEDHSTASQTAKRLALTRDWIDVLFEVHAHQIFNLGLFNADCHPGNILVVDEDTEHPKLGLIDFGQCKRLAQKEQAQVARLLVSVANQESDETIAAAFRDMGIQTKNDNTQFLAKFARLMFGPLQSYHLDHSWHQELHRQDAVTYFPNQLSMVYRTSMLLRGLAVSLQFNVSVGDLWKSQAQEALERYDASRLALDSEDASSMQPSCKRKVRLVRRMTSDDVVKELQGFTSKNKQM